MKNVKRLFLVILALFFVFGLVACEGATDKDVEQARTEAQAEVDALFNNLDRENMADEDKAVFDQLQAYANLFVKDAKSASALTSAVETVKQLYQQSVNNLKPLATAKEAALAEVNGLLSALDEDDLAAMSDVDVEALNNIVAFATGLINAATSLDSIDDAKATAKTLFAARLADPKEDSILKNLGSAEATLNDLFGTVYKDALSEKDVKFFDDLQEDALADLEEAESNDEINAILVDTARKFDAKYNEVLEGAIENTTPLVEAVFAGLDRSKYTEDQLAAFDALKENALKALEKTGTLEALEAVVSSAQKGFNNLVIKFDDPDKYANGVQSFVASSYTERTEILAILEAYAYEHFLTGFSLIDDGGYQLFSKTVQRGVTKYVPGYGWATLSDGEIIADLSGETNAAWKRYYHTFETSDPAQINYADDKGAVVGDFIGYVASGYWDTRLNETNDGYEWYSLLANEKPVAQNADEVTHLATQYKWEIKVGGDLKYDTLTTKPTLAAFKDRAVEAQDYITPYQMYYTKKLGWARSAENLDGAGSIKGAAAYYAASAEGFNATAWENVGIKVSEEDGKWYMSVEFNVPCTPFYAMYYMASSMFSPVPQAFIEELGKLNGAAEGEEWVKGAAIFGKTNIDLGVTPVDTFLSLGVYTIEAWVKDEEIVFKRNPNYTICGEDRYKIAGIHFDILEAAANDPEAAWKELNAGNLSACGVPSTQKQDRTRNDDIAYAVYTPGSGNYKLNVNACDQKLWNQLFGTNGSITKTKVADYWECEPAMSNTDFLLGLSWAIDRVTFAESLGRGPSINYFGDAYLSDPENGIVYNTTEAHQAAMADLTQNGEYEYGYNLEIAKEYFDSACQTFIEEGIYKEGDTIEIEIAWQTTSQFTTYGDPLIEMWQSAFKPIGDKYGLTLKVENWAGAVWSDVYYKKMMVGQFDIGFGSISGNALNPINFLEVLKSDNSSGFTLNWGSDTSEVNLEYNGKLWSFDSLWQAADAGGFFEQGTCVPAHAADMLLDETGEDYDPSCYTENEDGSVTLIIDTNMMVADGLVIDVENVAFDGYNGAGKYVEWKCDFEFDSETGLLTVEVEKEAVDTLLKGNNNAYINAAHGHYVMIDVYYANSYNRIPSSEIDTVEFAPEWLPEAE